MSGFHLDFSQAWVSNLFRSFCYLAFLVAAVFILFKAIQRMRMRPGLKFLFKKWILQAAMAVYVLILFRIWALAGLFQAVQNPAAQKLVKSGIAFILVYLVFYFARQFINSMKMNINSRHRYRKRAAYVAAAVYLLVLIPIWADTQHQWGTMLSVMGAGLALALHEMLLNLAGWIYIMIRNPYRAGDRIELGQVRGDVIDIRMFHTFLLEIGSWSEGEQHTGRLVHLPHGQIFRNALYNYSEGFEYIWNELSVVITYESNWQKAREILLDAGRDISRFISDRVKIQLDKMTKEYLIEQQRVEPAVFVSIEDSGVKLTLRYPAEVKKRRAGEDALSRRLLEAFEKAPDIGFAYSTFRITGDAKERGSGKKRGR
ncbi:mechanosensitive ion channel [bacterium]|nr:mechanosensitive ion channel [bacterium]